MFDRRTRDGFARTIFAVLVAVLGLAGWCAGQSTILVSRAMNGAANESSQLQSSQS